MLRAAFLAIAVAFALVAVPAASASEHPKLLAGAGVGDITPPIGSPMFAYTSRSMVLGPDQDIVTGRGAQMVYDPDTGMYAKTFRAGQGIHTRVLSRALVFERDHERYALVQADLGGLPYALTQEVVRRIADTGITADRLLLSATHTHSSTGAIWPDVDNSGYAFVGGDAFDQRIFDLTAAGISEAIHNAVAHLEPARAGMGAVRHTGASRNRAFEAFQLNKEVQGLDPAAQRAASTDPTFTVLRVEALSGRPIAVWSNFAAHPTTLDDTIRLFSGDAAGAAARLTEHALAADYHAHGGDFAGHPVPVDVWTNGAQGDISSDGDQSSVNGQAEQYDATDAAHADLAGERDAAGILEAWRAAGSNLSDSLPIRARRTLIQFDGTNYGADGGMQEPVGPFPVLGLGVIQENQCAPVDGMSGPGQGPKAPLVGGPGIAPDTFPVSFWQVGGLGIAAFPAEITKQMGQRIRDDLFAHSGGSLDRIALAGLTNGYISYTTTPEEYNSCDYEASFTLFGRQEGYAWMAFGRQLLGNLLHGTPLHSHAEPTDYAVADSHTTPFRLTADAGTITAQPAAALTRFGRAIFKWRGGDQQIDPARGVPFVSLQRLQDSAWQTVGTEDSLSDTTARADGEWTETWQFDQCSAPGTYRLSVEGVAVKNPGEAPSGYSAVSSPFTVSPVTLQVAQPEVTDGVASVRPLYPDPGAALLALPRLVRGAAVLLTVDGREVAATDPDGDGTYTAPVDGAVTAVSATDACENTGEST